MEANPSNMEIANFDSIKKKAPYSKINKINNDSD